MNLPTKLANMTPYNPETESYPVRLDANESFLPPPDWLCREIHNALGEVPLHRYPDPNATGVRMRAAALYGVDAWRIVAGNGSDELISLIMASLLSRGGRVLLTDPDFSMYRFYASLYELDCTALGKPDRRIDVDDVLKEAERRPPDLVIFSNPSNPAGLGVTRAETLRLLSNLSCPVVVDEAYMDFWDQSVLDAIPVYENLVVLKTCSKAYGLAGTRLGFAISGAAITEALGKTKSPYNVNALTQAVGEVVLSHPGYLRDCKKKIKAAKVSLFEGLSRWTALRGANFRVLPTETNFVLLQTADAPHLFAVLRQQGVLVRKLSNTMLRVTAGSEKEHEALYQALNVACC